MNNRILLLGWIVVGLFAVALVTRNGDIAWMMIPFLVYLAIGISQTPALEELRFSATRTLERDFASADVSVNVCLGLQNQGRRAVQVFIHEAIQPGMKITSGGMSRWAELRPGETAEMKYSFTAARGQYGWKSIDGVVSDPLGLIETELSCPASGMIEIRPQKKRFKAIPFRPDSTLHSPGSIPARLAGGGTDFFGVREYHPGDPLRQLDWRLTARHPHKFFTKQFEQEEIAEIGLILDARCRTDLWIGEESLFEICVGAAASLSEMFLHQGHRLSMFVFGEESLQVFPGYGKMQLHRILSCLSNAKVGTENRALSSLDFIPIRMFPSHALVTIISPLTAMDRSLFVRLRAYGYQVLLVSPDPIDFASPILCQDLAGRLAIRAARLQRRVQLNDIAQLHISVIDWPVRQALFPLLRNALTRPRGRRER